MSIQVGGGPSTKRIEDSLDRLTESQQQLTGQLDQLITGQKQLIDVLSSYCKGMNERVTRLERKAG